jgi:hypothetical protein
MRNFSTVLNQLLQFLPQTEFETAIKAFKSDRYVKYFKTKHYLLFICMPRYEKRIV